jgi:hypothetical protein
VQKAPNQLLIKPQKAQNSSFTKGYEFENRKSGLLTIPSILEPENTTFQRTKINRFESIEYIHVRW